MGCVSNERVEVPKWARFALALTALIVGGAVTLDIGSLAIAGWLPCPAVGPCLRRPLAGSIGLTVLASLCLALTWLAIQGSVANRYRMTLATLLPLVALFLVLPML